MATGAPPGERRLRGAGIYPRAAMLNHDCLPNLARLVHAHALCNLHPLALKCTEFIRQPPCSESAWDGRGQECRARIVARAEPARRLSPALILCASAGSMSSTGQIAPDRQR